MRTGRSLAGKLLAAAGIAALAAPAMACDLEAFGERRFSAFGGMHMGGQQAPEPAPPPAPSEQQQGGGADSEPSGDRPRNGSDALIEGSGGTTEPGSVSDGQGDAATFR